MPALAVSAQGLVTHQDLADYRALRTEEVSKRLETSWSSRAREWYDNFSEKELYDPGGKYLGDESGEAQAVAAVQRAKAAVELRDIVTAVEDVIINFCGFHTLKTKYISNALHFQFGMNVGELLGTALTSLAEVEAPNDFHKAFFDDAEIVSAELLLRVIRETDDGNLLADPFSPGQPMGKLLKLPLFAQFIMVLTNAVEAVWYQQEIPDCPMAINLYASLLVDGAPLLQMVENVQQVEIMELIKGAKRGPSVVEWVTKIRELGSLVLLDDFDASHPALDSEPDGFKVSVFANAFHALQVIKEGGVPAQMPFVDKEKTKDNDFKDYYCSLVPKAQPKPKIVVFEGSENCIKSEVKPGPPLNFKEPKATVASLHLCQAAAKVLSGLNKDVQLCRQGGRGLYDDEEFDPEATMVIAKTGKDMSAARTDQAGTMAWMGQEGVRRAAMKLRPIVCGVRKKDVPVVAMKETIQASPLQLEPPL